jgi:hypothetical protein
MANLRLIINDSDDRLQGFILCHGSLCKLPTHNHFHIKLILIPLNRPNIHLKTVKKLLNASAAQ